MTKIYEVTELILKNKAKKDFEKLSDLVKEEDIENVIKKINEQNFVQINKK